MFLIIKFRVMYVCVCVRAIDLLKLDKEIKII